METNRLNMFGIGVAVIFVVTIAGVFYTNPELITSWLAGETLKGRIEWASDGTVYVYNDSNVDWEDIRITLNKGIVAQRYEASVPSEYKVKAGGSFHVGLGHFKKSNGDAYKLENGKPHTITAEVALPEGKKGILEIQLGEKKL